MVEVLSDLVGVSTDHLIKCCTELEYRMSKHDLLDLSALAQLSLDDASEATMEIE